MTVRRGRIMFVIGLILAIGGLNGAGPQVFNPRLAQATTSGCTPSSDLFGCTVTGTSSSYGMKVENSSTADNMIALFGNSTGTSGITQGVYGQVMSPVGRAVVGYAKATSGGNIGIHGRSDSSSGIGVDGYAAATSGINYGVRGRTQSTMGIGVYGEFTPSSGGGIGVWGQTNSTSGTSKGVIGYASQSTGLAAAVYGQTNSIAGYGVYADAANTSGSSFALYAINDSHAGYAVYASQPYSPGWAGYFDGSVYASGGYFGPGGPGLTKIDNPLDPTNKYLVHAAVASPELQTVYNGNVTTDMNGNATVVLPDYVEALNRDFRYQLTVVGQFAQAIVASEIKNNRFTIKTDKPSVKVSWQIIGIRKDPYAEQHPVQVVVNKPANERGTYLYPQGYGQPETKGIDYQRRQLSRLPKIMAPTTSVP